MKAIFIFLATTVSAMCQNLVFEKHPIDLTFQGIHAIKVIDMDDDGDLDIVCGSEITPISGSIGIHWLRNDGDYPVIWTRFEIDASFKHVMSVDVDYVDSDNHPDILATSWSFHQVAWWKNSGDPTQDWNRQIIRSNFINAHDAKFGDLNHDGNVDVVAASRTPGSIMIFYNDGSPNTNWLPEYLTNSFLGASRVLVTDLDKDDALDIIATASDDNEIAWWNNAGGNPVVWNKNRIDSSFTGSADLYVMDMNDDAFDDVIANAASSNQVAYWICNDLQNNFWTKFVVASDLEIAAKVSGGDLDGDDDIDIVAVGKVPGELVIYQNSDFNWSKYVLADNFYGGTALSVIDFDFDGDLDIIAGASGLGELYLWENKNVSSVKRYSGFNSPDGIQVFQNYPNPFNPSTKIKYQIPEISFVSLKVYDVLGNEIAILVSEEKSAGSYEIEYDGRGLQSGVYFYRLKAGNFNEMKKMILLK